MNIDVNAKLTELLNYYPLEVLILPYTISDKRSGAFDSKMLKSALLKSLPSFEFCVEWLIPCEKRKSINAETNTFLLTNLCEKHYKAPLCEGIFVMAAIVLGFEAVQRYEPFGLTFRLNISQKSVTSKIQEAKLLQLNELKVK